MTLLLAALAQAVHVLALAIAVPALVALEGLVTALAAGTPLPAAGMFRQELRRLARKTPMRTETGSWLFCAAPTVAFAMTVVAGLLVPSFTAGMLFGPWADLLTVLGLLTLARTVLLCAALDGGTGRAGAAVAERVRLVPLAEAVVLWTAAALALFAGGLNLNQIAAAQLETSYAPMAAVVLAGLGLLALVLIDRGADAIEAEAAYAGLDLALLRVTAVLRRLVWLNLVALVLLPVGLAAPDAGIAGWLTALPLWAVKLGVLAAILAAVQGLAGDMPAAWMPRLLGMGGLLGVLAALIALARSGAA